MLLHCHYNYNNEQIILLYQPSQKVFGNHWTELIHVDYTCRHLVIPCETIYKSRLCMRP